MFPFEVMASRVSGESVYVLLRLRMRLQSVEGLVLYVMVLRRCLNVVCCSCRISGVGRSCLKWFLVQFLCLMVLLKPGLNCLIAPVAIYYLLLCMTIVLE